MGPTLEALLGLGFLAGFLGDSILHKTIDSTMVRCHMIQSW